MPFIHNIDPVLLQIGPLEIRYYGLVYVLGAIIGILVLEYYRRQGKLELSKNEVWDFVFYLLLGVVIGSRLFELFWEPVYYFRNPLEILAIWKGGMSFHGGLVGIVTAGYLYCKKKKLNLGKMADILAIPLAFVLGLGRIANFINGELVGTVTRVGWCFKFPGYEGCRHPVQLYGALKRFLVFGILIFLGKKEHKSGFIFWLFVGLMGLGRFLIDFWREDLRWLGLSLGQYFSLMMLIVAVIVLVGFYKEDLKCLKYSI